MDSELSLSHLCDCRVGCIILYTGQGKFHGSTSDTLNYVVHQAKTTAENLRNVSDYLTTAKQIGVDSIFLPASVQNNINAVQGKIDSSAATLSAKTMKNAKDIQDGLDSM